MTGCALNTRNKNRIIEDTEMLKTAIRFSKSIKRYFLRINILDNQAAKKKKGKMYKRKKNRTHSCANYTIEKIVEGLFTTEEQMSVTAGRRLLKGLRKGVWRVKRLRLRGTWEKKMVSLIVDIFYNNFKSH